MKIAIGSDHAGFALKTLLKKLLEDFGDEVQDFGTDSEESCDYPDIAFPLGESVASGNHDFGILICSNSSCLI